MAAAAVDEPFRRDDRLSKAPKKRREGKTRNKMQGAAFKKTKWTTQVGEPQWQRQVSSAILTQVRSCAC